MCQEKPGPRCSSNHIVNELNALKGQDLDLKLKLHDLHEKEGDDWMYSEEYAELSSSFKRNFESLERAQLNFNATSGGKAVLEAKVARANLNDSSLPEPIALDEGHGHNYSIEVFEGLRARTDLNAGATHRKWQKNALKSFKKAEATSPETALFCAQTVRQDLELKLRAAKADHSASSDWETADMVYDEWSSSDNYKKSIAAALVQEKRIITLKYAQMKIADIKSYEAKMSKKILGKSPTSFNKFADI